MIARDFALALVCLALLFPSPPAQAAPTNRNVVVIMLDDVGTESLSGYGIAPGQDVADQAQTPNLDALAQSGVTFDRFYTYPVCAPARAAFHTGLDSHDSGYAANAIPAPLDIRHLTIAKAFQSEQYATGHFGKWNRRIRTADGECHPQAMGFDHTEGQMGRPEGHFNWPRAIGCSIENPNEDTYQDTSFVNAAISFAQGQQAVGRPYFLFIALASAHNPWEYPPHALTREDPDLHGMGTRPPGKDSDTPADNLLNVAYYNAIISAADHEIGRLIDVVTAVGDTTIVVTSDNGTPSSMVDERFFDPRKAKGTPFQQGVNVPLIVAGPDVAPSYMGSHSNVLVQMTDLFATLVDIEAIDTPVPSNSKSFRHALTGDPAPPNARTIAKASIFRPYGFESAKRVEIETYATDGRYVVLEERGRTNGIEMYDLDLDPHQTKNLVGSFSPAEKVVYDSLVPHLYVVPGNAACSNGADDDGDGFVDLFDEGCEGDLDTTECVPGPNCNIGAGDGRRDRARLQSQEAGAGSARIWGAGFAALAIVVLILVILGRRGRGLGAQDRS